MAELKNRIDFVYIFDVQDGNPNGDPDAGNLPRVDAETGMGLVTDVCLKRKVRNYVQVAKECADGYDIYIKEKAVLGRSHIAAFNALGYKLGEESKKEIPNDLVEELCEASMFDGLTISEEDDTMFLIVEGNADKKNIQEWLKESELSKEACGFIKKALKDAKPRKQTQEETEGGRQWMCSQFYDIRTFGAVLSLKSAPNCGQVRGPIQLTFARSVDKIVASEHSITRMAVATEKEAEKQGGDNRTMGRKATVPYGLYICHGFISANLAQQTGFSEEDLNLFWEALKNMFDVDRSAARGLMSAQKLIVFKHESVLGNAPANKLFDRVKVEKKCAGAPRKFEDYDVTIDRDNLPVGVTIEEMI
ncbi:MAG: type I-C CRISPR-associated protein Cas7/Csd2 [Prevotella sp.]|nr:type I-C CRISPR-associated protein Cas7/Csd2 [Prevotella sp.]